MSENDDDQAARAWAGEILGRAIAREQEIRPEEWDALEARVHEERAKVERLCTLASKAVQPEAMHAVIDAEMEAEEESQRKLLRMQVNIGKGFWRRLTDTEEAPIQHGWLSLTHAYAFGGGRGVAFVMFFRNRLADLAALSPFRVGSRVHMLRYDPAAPPGQEFTLTFSDLEAGVSAPLPVPAEFKRDFVGDRLLFFEEGITVKNSTLSIGDENIPISQIISVRPDNIAHKHYGPGCFILAAPVFAFNFYASLAVMLKAIITGVLVLLGILWAFNQGRIAMYRLVIKLTSGEERVAFATKNGSVAKAAGEAVAKAIALGGM